MHRDAFPVPTADRTAMLERMLDVMLVAGDTYLSQISAVAELAHVCVVRMRSGLPCDALLAELEQLARSTREGIELDMRVVRCMTTEVLPTLP